jgi:hypothetical protein
MSGNNVPNIPDQLRAIAMAMPDDARVILQVPNALNEQREFVPLAPQTSEVTIFTGGLWSSFYVSDDEWETGTAVDEIVAHMKTELLRRANEGHSDER